MTLLVWYLSSLSLAYWLCLLLCERLDTLFGLTHGFCNKTAHVVERGEKMTHFCVFRVQRSRFYSEKHGAIYASGVETDGERMWYQCVFCPYMNFEFNACSYSLTSCVNLRCHSQTDSGPDLNMSAPFIPAATALPFTSCHKGQRAATFGVQPSHWIIHDIDLFFFPYFSPCLSLFFWSAHMVVLWEAFIHLAHL